MKIEDAAQSWLVNRMGELETQIGRVHMNGPNPGGLTMLELSEMYRDVQREMSRRAGLRHLVEERNALVDKTLGEFHSAQAELVQVAENRLIEIRGRFPRDDGFWETVLNSLEQE